MDAVEKCKLDVNKYVIHIYLICYPSFNIALQPPALDKGTLWKVIIDILTEPTPRQKLDHINFLDDVVELLRGSKNVIVLTGAGVCYLRFVFINKPCWNECAQSAHDK